MKARRLRGLGALSLLALASLVVGAPSALEAPVPQGHVVEYWVAAVPVAWHVVPNERDAIGHMEFTPDKTTFKTIVYERFTPNWAKPIAGQGGIGGPLLHARVGDTILVHFENLDSLFNRSHSMHFHGVHYRFGSDGSYIPGYSGPGANVKPGQTFTYRLVAGPDSVGVWPFHDHSPSMDDSIAGGLYGVLSILGPNEKPPDHEFVVFFGTQLGFMTIDGRAFLGNTPVFHARVGDEVQWDVLALGDDFHTFHVHAHRWQDPSGRIVDTQTVGPAESFRIRWKEDAPGTWLYHCHVESHMMNGMIGIYVVQPR